MSNPGLLYTFVEVFLYRLNQTHSLVSNVHIWTEVESKRAAGGVSFAKLKTYRCGVPGRLVPAKNATGRSKKPDYFSVCKFTSL